MTKFGIKARVAAGIICAVVVISIVLVSYFSIQNVRTDKQSALNLMSNTSDRIASEIKGRLNIGLGRTRSLTNTYRSIRNFDTAHRDSLIFPFLFDAMNANKNYLAFWISFELKYIDPSNKDDSGRKTWLVHHLGSGLDKTFEYRGTQGIPESPQYLSIKQTKKEELIDPYWYHPKAFKIDHDSILEATIAVPVITTDNTVIGLAGIDFKLNQFDSIIKESDRASNCKTFLISHSGIVVFSPDSNQIGKPMDRIALFNRKTAQILDSISKDTISWSGEFMDIANHKNYYHLSPVRIGNSTQAWYVCEVASHKEILKNAKNLVLESLGIGLVGIVLMIILIYFIAGPVIKPIIQTIQVLDSLSQGNINQVIKLNEHTRHELGIMAGSVNRIQERFKVIAGFAADIGKGKLDTIYPFEIENDMLGQSLSQMQAELIEFRHETTKKDWVKTGIAGLNDALRLAGDLDSLARICIKYIARYFQLPVGVIYFADESNKSLRLGAGYALTKDGNFDDFIAYGEGLVGECALERECITLNQIPENYFLIKSATGAISPNEIIVIPCLYNRNLQAVIELGKLSNFSPDELELVKNFSENIAITVQNVKAKDEMSALLSKTMEQKEELQAQEEELREANQELERNAQLLEEQSEKIAEKNRSLEIASGEIEQKSKDLEQASRYNSEFLANMSHELRTPLNSMLILSQSLAENSSGHLSADEIESAQIIFKSGNDLHNLINEILDLSKIEAGKMTINKQNVDIHQIEGNITSLYRAAVANKGLTFTVTIEPGCPVSLITDQQRTEQIIKNLVSNAIKFTSKGGITITFSKAAADRFYNNPALRVQQNLAITVSDTGIGIPPDKQQAIFEAFQQADGSISRKFGGTGLGLSISKELARLLGGEIQIASTMGQGSVFTLILPATGSDRLIKSDEAAEIKRLTEIPEVKTLSTIVDQEAISMEDPELFIPDDRDNLSLDSELILVIEDDQEFAKILFKQCHSKHFKCIIAGDGESGYKLIKKHKPAAIILDIKLPGMDGWRVLDLIKHDPEIRHIPVHMMSSMDETIEAYQKGAIGYLKKPVNAESLSTAFEKIEHFLEKKMKHLLIVEDNELMRKTIQHLLKGSDIIIHEVPTAQECLEALQNGIYDCIILDLGLPDKNGMELIRIIRELKLSPTPPIIVYTGQELTKEQNEELNKYTKSIIIKGVRSEERLLDEATLFLHRVVEDLTQQQQTILKKLYEKEDTFEGKKILLVDDDMRNIFALSKVFEEKGIRVLKAANGLKALEILEDNIDTDAILMDIMMPEMDGFECIQNIRKDFRFRSTPIIAVTAKAMKEDRQKCLDAGASDYISKPVDINKLFSLLRVWIRK